MKKSPFHMMGYNPRPLLMVFERTDIPSVENRLKEVKRIQEEVLSLMEIVQQKMIMWEKTKLNTFKEGQKVWLKGKNLIIGYPLKKLSPKRERPFKITKVLDSVTYQLELPPQWKIHPVFQAALLSPYQEIEAHGPSFMEPPPNLVEGFEEYEVEVIIGYQPQKNPREFLVSWKEYDPSHNRWIKKKRMTNCLDLYLDYIRGHELKA
ncbi:hypothetical protein Moror_15863 [Moniliophthora roreri MCA 2997]|uniref:Chromo domain-containing protein n=1 Tax=Moniliophthora roreri (strain MCA 2997) TaxID=1381753 RepID=V2WJC4_MONRO|nr:hypothetical protein Moror_15863 [Moniliophthora roreri MCA 2997]